MWGMYGWMDGCIIKTNFVPSLVSLDCRLRLLENLFGIIFLKNGFIFLLLVSQTCSKPQQDLFVLIFSLVT